MAGFDPSEPRDEQGRWVGPGGPKRRSVKEVVRQATFEKAVRTAEAAAAAGGIYLAYHRHRNKIEQAKNIALMAQQFRKGF